MQRIGEVIKEILNELRVSSALNKEVLRELKGLRTQQQSSGTDYAKTDEAVAILGIKDSRKLKFLRECGHFASGEFSMRGGGEKRGKYFLYKKSALYRIAQKLDAREIIIPGHKIKSLYETK